MKKPFRFTAMILASFLLTGFMAGCGQSAQSGNEGTSSVVSNEGTGDSSGRAPTASTRAVGKDVPVTRLSQVAEKNENFLETEVSWYDDDYNYYVYNVGKIKNVPLTSTYATFYYDGGDITYEREVSKATEKTMQVSTSKAVTSSVSTTVSAGMQVTKGVSADLKGIIGASVERGYSISVSNTNTHETEWTNTYQSGVMESEKETNKLKLVFNSECEKGNYLYLFLASINVYYAVIQPKATPNQYYVETYTSIYNYKYVLNYTGDDDEYPIDHREKIEVDTSFIADLETPTEYIPGKKVEASYEPIFVEHYWEENLTVEPLETYAFWITNGDIGRCYAEGYNKIDISYKFYTKGGWSLLGGNVNIDSYIASKKDSEDRVFIKSDPSSKNGTWIEHSNTMDLAWFKNTNQVYVILKNNNYTESFTVSKMTITLKIYRA